MSTETFRMEAMVKLIRELFKEIENAISWNDLRVKIKKHYKQYNFYEGDFRGAIWREIDGGKLEFVNYPTDNRLKRKIPPK